MASNVCTGFLLVNLHWYVHKGTLLISLSLLLWLCSACLNRLTRIVSEMGGKWLYGCCFVGCYFEDLTKIAQVKINYQILLKAMIIFINCRNFFWDFYLVNVVILFCPPTSSLQNASLDPALIQVILFSLEKRSKFWHLKSIRHYFLKMC